MKLPRRPRTSLVRAAALRLYPCPNWTYVAQSFGYLSCRQVTIIAAPFPRPAPCGVDGDRWLWLSRRKNPREVGEDYVQKIDISVTFSDIKACAGGVGGYGPKTTTGAAAGGAAGGLIGSELGGPAATAAGVLLGGLLGGAVGQQMDSHDYYQMRNSLETSRTGQPTEWHNPNTGAHTK